MASRASVAQRLHTSRRRRPCPMLRGSGSSAADGPACARGEGVGSRGGQDKVDEAKARQRQRPPVPLPAEDAARERCRPVPGSDGPAGDGARRLVSAEPVPTPACPAAVCRPRSRESREQGEGLPDQWGAPDEQARFRDDNSLVKSLPRSLEIENAHNLLLHRRPLGTGFVASHAWRQLAPSGAAARNPATYSFVPNLVWLPLQVSKLTDREGHFVRPTCRRSPS